MIFGFIGWIFALWTMCWAVSLVGNLRVRLRLLREPSFSWMSWTDIMLIEVMFFIISPVIAWEKIENLYKKIRSRMLKTFGYLA